MVATVVVAMSILVIFAIRMVMTMLVADDIGERKSVVICDKVYARQRRSAALFEQVSGTVKSLRKFAD